MIPANAIQYRRCTAEGPCRPEASLVERLKRDGLALGGDVGFGNRLRISVFVRNDFVEDRFCEGCVSVAYCFYAVTKINASEAIKLKYLTKKLGDSIIKK